MNVCSPKPPDVAAWNEALCLQIQTAPVGSKLQFSRRVQVIQSTTWHCTVFPHSTCQTVGICRQPPLQ